MDVGNNQIRSLLQITQQLPGFVCMPLWPVFARRHIVNEVDTALLFYNSDLN